MCVAAPQISSSAWVRAVEGVAGPVFEQEVSADLPANMQVLSLLLYLGSGATAASVAYGYAEGIWRRILEEDADWRKGRSSGTHERSNFRRIDAAVRTHEEPEEVRTRWCLSLQPLQTRTRPLPRTPFNHARAAARVEWRYLLAGEQMDKPKGMKRVGIGLRPSVFRQGRRCRRRRLPASQASPTGGVDRGRSRVVKTSPPGCAAIQASSAPSPSTSTGAVSLAVKPNSPW